MRELYDNEISHVNGASRATGVVAAATGGKAGVTTGGIAGALCGQEARGIIAGGLAGAAAGFAAGSQVSMQKAPKTGRDAGAAAGAMAGAAICEYERSSSGSSEGGGGGGCVEVRSKLPCGKAAGEITLGDIMQLADEKTLEAGKGSVSFSKRKSASGFRITTTGGVSLVCSDTAPIPTRDGIVLAPNVAGKSVAVRRDANGMSQVSWEDVSSVESVGQIDIQHITVGDKCFWAGESDDGYILHHNLKQETTADGRIIYDGVDVTGSF